MPLRLLAYSKRREEIDLFLPSHQKDVNKDGHILQTAFSDRGTVRVFTNVQERLVNHSTFIIVMHYFLNTNTKIR